MADAATLTIDIREGAASPNTPGPPAAPAVPLPPAPYQPLPHPNGTLPSPIGSPRPAPTPAAAPVGTSTFDPVAEAQKRLEREQQRAAIDAEYAKLNPPVVTAFDPVAEAQKRLKRDEQLAAIDAEYERLVPQTLALAFDPVAEAQKRLDREKELNSIEAEYAKLSPPEAFDPVALARKRLEREQQQSKVDEEYKKLNPGERPGALSSLGKVAQFIPGQAGGVAQKLVGGAQKGGAALEAAGTAAESLGLTGVAELAAAAGPAAIAVGAVAAAAALTVYGFKKLTDVAEDFAKRLSPYSAPLALASAEAEVRQVLGDLRRAQLLGTDLSRFTRAGSELSQGTQDIIATLLKPVIPLLSTTLEAINAFLSVVPVGALALSIQTSTEILTGILEGVRDGLKGFEALLIKVDVISESLKKSQDGPDDIEQIWQRFEGTMAWTPDAPTTPTAARSFGRDLVFPAFVQSLGNYFGGPLGGMAVGALVR